MKKRETKRGSAGDVERLRTFPPSLQRKATMQSLVNLMDAPELGIQIEDSYEIKFL
jgi:hypothetical protein